MTRWIPGLESWKGRSALPSRSLAALTLGILALALFTAAPAAAAPGWLPATNISQAGGIAGESQVAVDPQGEAVAVWTNESGSKEFIQAATHPIGGAWSAPVSLTSPAQEANEPQVAIDAQGSAVAVWDQEEATGLWVVKAATRPVGGHWSTPTTLSAAGQEAVSPQVAVDPQGNAVVAWDYLVEETAGEEYVVKIQAATEVDGHWSAPVALSAKTTSDEEELPSPQVAIDPQGNAITVWELYDESVGSDVVQARTRRAGGNWSAATTISSPGEWALAPQVAVDAEDNAVVVWEGYDGGAYVARARTHLASGSWGATPESLSVVGEDASHPQVAVDPQGNAVAVWELNDETAKSEIVQARTRPAGGAWSATTTLSGVEPGMNAEAPQVAVNSQGTAVAVWHRSDEGDWIVQGAIHPAASAWSAAANLSYTTAGEESKDPQVAIDPQGNAVAVWQRKRGAETVIQAGAFDTGPRLSGLSIPATGTVGRPVPFSVVEFDAWAPVRTSWRFGDGGAAHGTAGTHTYTRPGVYTVRVRMENSLHSVVTGTGRISVAAPPRVVTHPAPPHPASPHPVTHGTAHAVHIAKVKGARARVRLHCRGAGPCRGHFSLTYRHKTKRVIRRHGKRKVSRHVKTVKLGSAGFRIAKGKSKTVAVKLSHRARKLVKKAGKHGLKVHLRGRDIKRRTVVLKEQAPKRKHHKRGKRRGGSRH